METERIGCEARAKQERIRRRLVSRIAKLVGQAKTKNQETKKPKKQKTKKPKNQKKKQIAHPKGRGSDAECWVLFFFDFLVCVWIAIADVPSRDCQALSVVALEARSIHYSTAIFAMK